MCSDINLSFEFVQIAFICDPITILFSKYKIGRKNTEIVSRLYNNKLNDKKGNEIISLRC